MEQKDIDIYEILKDEEYGTELYTPICGKVWHSGMANDKDSAKAIWTEDEDGREHFFDKNGKVSKEGEVLLFPSKEMRDWSKFFKKGDVLVNEDGSVHIIFEEFEDDAYTMFSGKYYYSKDGKKAYSYFRECDDVITEEFTIETEDAAQTYISAIEERLGGKLNLQTLEIEKQLEFKDGDIVVYGKSVAICRKIYKHTLSFYVSLNEMVGLLFADEVESSEEYRFATEEEKEQLFSALEKKGKRWDIEKKQIVDLKPAFEIGKLYVFKEEDEDGELTIIGKLIDKNESEDTLIFGNQYEIENEKFVTDQTFDLRISVNKELREATDDEYCTFREAYYLWEKSKEKKSEEQSAFKTFDKVLVSNGEEYNWQPAFFVSDRGEGAIYRYNVLPIQSGKVADFAFCIPFEGNEHLAFTSDPF